MRKLFSKDKIKFFTKVTVAHTLTYILVGVIASELLNYEANLLEIFGLRNPNEIGFLTIVFAQIVRGILFGIVIWWIKDNIIGKRLAWLKLWAILVILGIVNTYTPASGSIEGFVFLDFTRFGDLPPYMSLSTLEVLVQPLLFSIIVTYQRKKEPMHTFR